MSAKSDAASHASEKEHWETFVHRSNPQITQGGIRQAHAAGFFSGRSSKGAKPPAPLPAPGKAEVSASRDRRRMRILNRRLQSIKRLHSQNEDGFCDECELESPCLTLQIIEGKHRPTEAH